MAQWRDAPVVGVDVNGGVPSGAGTSAVDALVARLGAPDVFVFRRVAEDRWVHLGGAGRGIGWAGLVDVRLRGEPLLTRATVTGEPSRFDAPRPGRVLGPYFARSAVAVPLRPDTVVVAGSADGPIARVPEAELRALAMAAAAEIVEVSPSKRLADELEVLHALRLLSGSDHDSLTATLEHVTRCAAEALSCELGLLYWAETDEVVTTAGDWCLPGTATQRHSALRALAAKADSFPLCAQDLATDNPLGPPFEVSAGCRSAYLLRVGGARAGVLVLVHTDAQPRGFTSLCQELGSKLAAAAGLLVRDAAMRERLRHEIDQAYLLARQDPLTGLANRRAWDEAVAAAQAQMSSAGPVSVVLADVVGLKRINDTLGLAAGDEVIRTAAAALTAAIRERDVLARLGGDEFALLLPDTDASDCRAVVTRIEPLITAAAAKAIGLPLSLSVGWATAERDGDLQGALEAADVRLCEAKRDRAAR